MRRHVWSLGSKAETYTIEHLVADPFAFARRGGESGEETCADGGYARAEDECGSVVADKGDELTVENGDDGDGDYHGEQVDAAGYGGFAFYGLEPDGEEVYWLFGLVTASTFGRSLRLLKRTYAIWSDEHQYILPTRNRRRCFAGRLREEAELLCRGKALGQ